MKDATYGITIWIVLLALKHPRILIVSSLICLLVYAMIQAIQCNSISHIYSRLDMMHRRCMHVAPHLQIMCNYRVKLFNASSSMFMSCYRVKRFNACDIWMRPARLFFNTIQCCKKSISIIQNAFNCRLNA